MVDATLARQHRASLIGLLAIALVVGPAAVAVLGLPALEAPGANPNVSPAHPSHGGQVKASLVPGLPGIGLAPNAPAGGSVATAGAGASALPTFTLVDSGATGSELTIGVTMNGDVWVGGWNSPALSMDKGLTWVRKAPSIIPGGAVSFSIGVAADRVLATDHWSNRVIVGDTALAGCTLVSWSDDRGASWNSFTPCTTGVTDHEKVAIGKRTTLADPTGNMLFPGIMYMCANGLASDNCAVSADGLTFAPSPPHGTLCAFQGQIVPAEDGGLYEGSVACGAQLRYTLNNGVSWTAVAVKDGNGQALATSSDAPDVAVTSDGTIYFSYTTPSWTPAFVRSTNRGASWSGPYDLSYPGLTSAAFPVIVGGAPGKVAFAYMGTTSPLGANRNPGNVPATTAWHAYVGIITDADQPAPTVVAQQLTAAADPLQYGCITKLGSCLGNIADYIDIDASPLDGTVYAVFVDGCLNTGGNVCTSAAQSKSDVALVAAQTGGPTLL